MITINHQNYDVVQGFGLDPTKVFTHDLIIRFLTEKTDLADPQEFFEDNWIEFSNLWSDRSFLKESEPYLEEALERTCNNIILTLIDASDITPEQTALMILNPSIGQNSTIFYDRSAAINYLVSSLLTLTDYRYAPHNAACPDFDELLYYLTWYCKTFNYDPMDHTVLIPLKKEAENNYAKDL